MKEEFKLDKYDKMSMLYTLNTIIKVIEEMKAGNKPYRLDMSADMWEIPDKKSFLSFLKKPKCSLFGCVLLHLEPSIPDGKSHLEHCFELVNSDQTEHQIYFRFKVIFESIEEICERGIDFYAANLTSRRSSDEVAYVFLDTYDYSEEEPLLNVLKAYKSVVDSL